MSAIPATDLKAASPWRRALPLFLLLEAAILLLYRDTGETMVGIWWRSETFAHAFLVLPISLWLVWRRRADLAVLAPRACPGLLLAVLAAALAWLLARLVVTDVVAQFAFVGLLILAVPAVLGLEVAGVILFPLLFLFFAVPFGEFVVPTMMSWTANFVVTALQFTGIPVYREGQHFIIPNGSWSVIDECSGVRYLMASFMVGTLFAYLNYRSHWRRGVFMVISLLMPVLANWLRAYLIVMLAYLSDNRIATGIDHILYGWVFFGFIIFLMFVVGARWAEPDAPPRPASTGGRPLPPQPARDRAMALTAAAAVVLVLLPHAAAGLLLRQELIAAPARLVLPAALGAGWQAQGAQGAQGAPLVAFQPRFSNPSVEAERAYAGPGGAAVGVDIAYYRNQHEGRKLVSSTNRLVAMRSDEWNLMPKGRREVSDGHGGTLGVDTAEILALAPGEPGTHRPHLVAWHFYWVDGRFIAGDVAAKLAGGLARLQGHGDEGALVLLYADAGSVPASEAALQAFVQANLGPLNALLLKTRDAR
ncbi:MAG: exosortase A [Burkholderiales bacterium]|nr:exosortase A [Burkholderiales bacterium]